MTTFKVIFYKNNEGLTEFLVQGENQVAALDLALKTRYHNIFHKKEDVFAVKVLKWEESFLKI